MKFVEELASQMVQEWETNYIDYNILTQALQDLATSRHQIASTSSSQHQAMRLRSAEEGKEGLELQFFVKLDDEFNKVDQFYKAKVQELKVDAESLLLAATNRVDTPPINGMKQVEAEEELRQAIIELYKKLKNLRSFSFLNLAAFSKLVKKYNKITSRITTSNAYLNKLENSYIATNDELYNQIGSLEATFIKLFANGNSRKGKKSLKMGQKRGKHITTFFLGLYTGSSIAMMIGIAVSIHCRGLLNHPGADQYMESIFPLYSLFGFIVMHLLMYGANVFLWRRFRVKYSSIFGFKPETELGFRQVFLIASCLSVVSLADVLSNLDMEMDSNTRKFSTLTELVPVALLIVVLVLTLCPWKILYRTSRFFFIRTSWRCICAPLHKVSFKDIFLADQLTSQVQALRSLLFYVFYYLFGDFTTRSNAFLRIRSYKILYIVVAIIPSWMRSVQCLRWLIEERNRTQGFNALKHLSTMVAISMRTMYGFRKGSLWRAMAATTSGIATIYGIYWDVVQDWGLLQRNSRNPWLREELLISNKGVYFGAIVVNILLRLVWMQSVLDFDEREFLHWRAIVALEACLEIIRRGIWNFFRLENEHLHRIAKNRAHKTAPLPSPYQD